MNLFELARQYFYKSINFEEKINLYTKLITSANFYKAKTEQLILDYEKKENQYNEIREKISKSQKSEEIKSKILDEINSNFITEHNDFLKQIEILKGEIDNKDKKLKEILSDYPKIPLIWDKLNNLKKEQLIYKSCNSLSFQRNQIPDLNNENYNTFVKICDLKKAITYFTHPKNINPLYNLEEDKVFNFLLDTIKKGIGCEKILITKDKYIVDGHLDWAIHFEMFPDRNLLVTELPLNLKNLLEKADNISLANKNSKDTLLKSQDFNKATELIEKSFKEGKILLENYTNYKTAISGLKKKITLNKKGIDQIIYQ